jgi:hypothetical protein
MQGMLLTTTPFKGACKDPAAIVGGVAVLCVEGEMTHACKPAKGVLDLEKVLDMMGMRRDDKGLTRGQSQFGSELFSQVIT